MSHKKGEGLKSFNKGFTVPDTYIIIFFVVVLAAILTFLVPKGYYETQDVSYMINGVEKTRTVIKDGSFQYLRDDAGKVVTEGVSLFSGDGGTGFFNYMYNGIVNSSAMDIIAFLLVVGGAFGIMIKTGALESGLIGLIRKAKGAEKLLIPVLFVLFSLGGAVFGMGEEALPFTMILCPLFVAVGYDTVIAVLVTYVATQIGFGSSWMNPFSVGVAQGIAGIDVFSGAGFRMVMWVVFTALGCGMTMFYASKVKKTPTISVAYESDQYFRDQNEKTGLDDGHDFGIGHILVLLTLAATVIWVIWGVMVKGYYMAEIATQFFIMGIVSGVIGVVFHLNNMKLNDIASSFKDGAKDLIGAALLSQWHKVSCRFLAAPTRPHQPLSTQSCTEFLRHSQDFPVHLPLYLCIFSSPYLTSLSYQVLDKLQSPCRSWHHLLIFLVFPVRPLFLHSSLVMHSPT